MTGSLGEFRICSPVFQVFRNEACTRGEGGHFQHLQHALRFIVLHNVSGNATLLELPGVWDRF